MGYSSQRKSLVMGKAAYGILTIPTTYAGNCPAPQGTQYVYNILPEIFFGFYNDTAGVGFDIGIRIDTGGTWVAFAYGTANYLSDNGHKEPFKSSIVPGETLYMKAWIQNSKVYLNVSRNSYTDTDLLSTPFQLDITNSTFAARANSGKVGYNINRELAIAQGISATSYETSGCYATLMKWNECGYMTTSNVTYPWTDEYSAEITYSALETYGLDGNNRRVIRLRKDGAKVNTNRIKLKKRTDGTNGATEKVSIDFRTTPQI